ncbi:MAG: diacylglycerol kinase family protein [Opitutus sp.]
MKSRFIVNPRSGRAIRALAEVERFARAHGAGIVLTERPGHASGLARQALADGCNLVVAVGGDGTMNEVATALIDTPATLGLIPCGSGDGLGRQLRIHGSITRALHLLHQGRPRQIDTATANGRPYFTTAGVGFEAEISQRFNRLERRGFASYLMTSAAALRGWEAQEYVVTHGDLREVFRAFTLTVANAGQYGNGAQIAPSARIDDGLLDLSAIPPVTFMNAVPLVFRLFEGTIGGATGVAIRRGARFMLERAQPGLFHTDGEVHSAGTTIEFAVRPASLRVMCPG